MRMPKYNPTLSILICSLPARERMLTVLMGDLIRQCEDLGLKLKGQENSFGVVTIRSVFFSEVEVRVAIDEKKVTTGAKRNLLMKAAKGEYVVYIDDDDQVPLYYIQEILEAAKEDSDCIGINGHITTDGRNQKRWYISNEYPNWYETATEYFRTPNHLSPIKREIAIQVPFPDKSSGEDSEFSEKILPYLKTQTKIEKPMYYYDFRTTKS